MSDEIKRQHIDIDKIKETPRVQITGCRNSYGAFKCIACPCWKCRSNQTPMLKELADTIRKQTLKEVLKRFRKDNYQWFKFKKYLEQKIKELPTSESVGKELEK